LRNLESELKRTKIAQMEVRLINIKHNKTRHVFGRDHVLTKTNLGLTPTLNPNLNTGEYPRTHAILMLQKQNKTRHVI